MANIALNFPDWHLQEHGLYFVRYADDFVALCKSEEQAKEAWVLVEVFLDTYLELKLCPVKSHVTTFSEGFAFLGFDMRSKSVTMQHKSIELSKIKSGC